MTTKTKKTRSVKQKCFDLVKNHPEQCLLYIYGDRIQIKTFDNDILSYLREAHFGDVFGLVYNDDVRFCIYVLCDTKKWIQISECMTSRLYSYTKDRS